MRSVAAAEMEECSSIRVRGALTLSFAAAGSAAGVHTVESTDTHACICYDACVLIVVRIKPEISPSLCSAVCRSRKELSSRTEGKESMRRAMRCYACVFVTLLLR